jgi:hypothetical protein
VEGSLPGHRPRVAERQGARYGKPDRNEIRAERLSVSAITEKLLAIFQ